MSKVNMLKTLGFMLCIFGVQLAHAGNVVAENEATTLVIIKGPYLQNVKKDGITIMWETNVEASSRIDYGETTDYGSKIICAQSKKIHEIIISGLEEESVYHYRVSSEVKSELTEGVLKVTSEDNVFKTAVREDTPFCFAVYGDSRSNVECHARIVNAIIEKRPDFVLHVGDVVSGGSNYKDWGSDLFEPARKLLKNTPVYIAMGNHEKNAQWFYDFVSYPEPENYYSFDYGNAHFIIIDSNKTAQGYVGTSDCHPGSTQYEWLKKDLKSSNSNWTFVFFHHPSYSSCPDYPGGSVGKMKFLSPLFEKYGVDIVFNGHIHNYERSYPLKNDKVDMKKGVVYIVTGGGGAILESLKEKRSFFTAESAVTYHYCLVKIVKNYFQMMVYDIEGKLLDFLIINK